MMVIREASYDDAEAIAKVHVDTWRTTYSGIVPQEHLDNLSYERRTRGWQNLLSEPVSKGFHLVALDTAGQIVAVASGGPERSGDPVYAGELYGLYILASHQRQGLGRRLTRAVVERLAQQGLYSMLVWVLADNASRRFYEALGGAVLREKTLVIGGAELLEVAYGWLDTHALMGEPAGEES